MWALPACSRCSLLSQRQGEATEGFLNRRGDNFMSFLERSRSLQDRRGATCEKTTEGMLGRAQVGGATAWTVRRCGRGETWWVCPSGTNWVWGQGWDGSGVPGLWMMRSFTERGEMRAGWAERVNSALVLTREMPGRPSEAAEWAAGH